MEDSILLSIKKTLNIGPTDTAFDEDVKIYINSAFATLAQLGVGPAEGFMIEGPDEHWSDLNQTRPLESMIKTYIQLRARVMFDPPAMSFHIDAMNDQIKEHEWRLNEMAERFTPLPR